jgi:hypothetical protein
MMMLMMMLVMMVSYRVGRRGCGALNHLSTPGLQLVPELRIVSGGQLRRSRYSHDGRLQGRWRIALMRIGHLGSAARLPGILLCVCPERQTEMWHSRVKCCDNGEEGRDADGVVEEWKEWKEGRKGNKRTWCG